MSRAIERRVKTLEKTSTEPESLNAILWISTDPKPAEWDTAPESQLRIRIVAVAPDGQEVSA